MVLAMPTRLMVLYGVALIAGAPLVVGVAGCAAEATALRPEPPAAAAQPPQLSAQDRALLLRLFTDTSGAAFDQRGAAFALIGSIYTASELPFDTRASARLEAWRVTQQRVLAFLVNEDPYAAARYVDVMHSLVPPRPRTGPLSDDELARVDPAGEVFAMDAAYDPERYLAELNAAALAERLVSEQRTKAGSAATHPPTRREIAAALLLRSPQLSADDEVNLRAEIGDACSMAARSGREALKAVWVAEEAHRAEFDSYTTDPKALGISVPDGFVLDVRLVAHGFQARLTGLPGSLVSGEAWTVDSDTTRPTRQSRGCTASSVDSAVFAPLLSEKEQRALADLVATRAMVDAGTQPGIAALEKLVEAYRRVEAPAFWRSQGVSVTPVAAVLTNVLRRHHPSMGAVARQRVRGFIPRLGAIDTRPLFETEERDLVSLSLEERPLSRTEQLRLGALLELLHANAGLSGDAAWEPVARAVRAVVRAHRPAQESAYLRRVRPEVCKATRDIVNGHRLIGGLNGTDAPALQQFGEQAVRALRAVGFEATLVDAASPETFAIDARMPAASVIAGHHVRIEGDVVRVVQDACSDARVTP